MKNAPIFAHLFLKAMQSLKKGTLIVTTPLGGVYTFRGTEDGPTANMQVKNWIFVKNLVKRGAIGFSEDYVEGHWDTDDLPTLLTVCAANSKELEKFLRGHWYTMLFFRLVDLMRFNSRRGSRKNIYAHYDLGNDFYKLWLDKTMTYSSALFAEAKTLEDAQRAKYGRILDKVGDAKEILEIGCGWGGFAEEASKRKKKVTGLTISPAQHEYATQRLKDTKSSIVLQDYRDNKGMFDAIVSIEMFEAVGEKYWPVYFKTIHDRLKKTGSAVIQTITIDDEEFPRYRKTSDFIRQYIFPGGMLPSISVFTHQAESQGLKVKEIYMFGDDYAKTLAIWLKNFDAKRAQIEKMGYNGKFIRNWRFYLAYCIAGFATGRTNVVQVELEHA